MKYAAGVVFYNPKEEDYKKIEIYKQIFDEIIVYDNTEDLETIKKTKSKIMLYNVKYIGNQSNDGLSQAYNEMCKLSIDLKMDYICLLDQDSFFEKENIKIIMETIEKNKNLKIGVYSPEIHYDHVVTNKEDSNDILEIRKVDWTISSGSFINLSFFKIIGGFDINYFIDRVDFDYCFSLKNKNIDTVIVSDSKMNQYLGETKKKMGKVFFQHSPLRHYYIYRNRLYFYKKKNKKNNLENLKLIAGIINHLQKIIFLEDQKIKKIKLIFKAHKDYKKSRMGKIKFEFEMVKNID
ncbi:glycosyltransferase [Exiguobacterium sp. 9-2]|uniref:glycosyltransferase n=1 Tax=Exiguobacterium sp. 9-2 TaxID=3112419 RepID=UPI002E364713|nr:glycosyltransferase [Exiguobacterium sp. 9-2]